MALFERKERHFPEISSLYTYQDEVIQHLLCGHNTLAIISTGGGKSLIFQLVALELEGVTIVVSPLIALMEEQVNELNSRGIRALALNSTISFDEQRNFLRNLSMSDIKLLYLSPERLQNGIFRASLAASGVKIAMLVIDEAHCVSQWGQSFRPDYAQISPFIEYLESTGQHPIKFALTATLAKTPREAIQEEFGISPDHTIVPVSVIRDNLDLQFREVEDEKSKEAELEQFLRYNHPKKTLVYLYSKKKCEEFSEFISSKGYKASYYHAGLDSEVKGEVYEAFKLGQLEVLFATTAFGMGINIPDIEAVIHVHIPNSIEEYYQHVGRGWREKTQMKVCHCLALWSETNFDRRKREISGEKINLEDLKRRITNLLGKRLKKGTIVPRDKEDYLYSSDNLQLIRFKLEEKGIIKTVGEINGSPLKIELFHNTELWNRILERLDGLDSFQWASHQSGVEISEIIEHLYEQEFAGNIKKLPASRRDIFFQILVDQIDEEVLQDIVSELNTSVDQRVDDLNDLKTLFQSKDPNSMIELFLA